MLMLGRCLRLGFVTFASVVSVAFHFTFSFNEAGTVEGGESPGRLHLQTVGRGKKVVFYLMLSVPVQVYTTLNDVDQ